MNASALDLSRAGLLLGALGASLGLRLVLAGTQGAGSISAGLIFSVALLFVAATAGWRPGPLRIQPVVVGVIGAVVLVAAPLLLRGPLLPSNSLPPADFVAWGLAVSVVAAAEEILLRGVLFSLVESVAGPLAAVAVSSTAFALLHVPLYGWSALPLDLAVGLWLGGLRLVSGGVAAPATAHILADLAGWWMV